MNRLTAPRLAYSITAIASVNLNEARAKVGIGSIRFVHQPSSAYLSDIARGRFEMFTPVSRAPIRRRLSTSRQRVLSEPGTP